MDTVILSGQRLKEFCKEINIKTRATKILININNNRAEYYDPDTDCYYKLELEIAKKYIKNG